MWWGEGGITIKKFNIYSVAAVFGIIGAGIAVLTYFNLGFELPLPTIDDVETITVSFDSNRGSHIEPITVLYESTYGSLPVPYREGYLFEGWYTTVSPSENSKITSLTTVDIDTDHILYAIWQKRDLSVSLYSNGEFIETISVEYGAPYPELQTPLKEGYAFSGWQTSSGESVNSSTIVSEKDNHSLYTKLLPLEETSYIGTPATATYTVGFGVSSTPPNFSTINLNGPTITFLLVTRNKNGDIIYPKNANYVFLDAEPSDSFIGWFFEGVQYKDTDEMRIAGLESGTMLTAAWR